MGPDFLSLGETLIGLAVFTIGSFLLGYYPGRRRRIGLELAVSQFERRAVEAQRANEDLWARLERADASVRGLQLSIVQIPEIAQRLSALRELREIPDGTLDLVQEIFQPIYSVFYRVNNGGLVAVACRGESEFSPGHRLQPGEGVAGWTAVKQLPFTPEDAELESAVVRSRNLARCLPRDGFSLCVPIMGPERPLGVILIGPSTQQLPHAREIGRTIALLSSVAIASTMVLSKERVLAKTDGLTGLLNKTNVYRRLRDLISGDASAEPISVFLLDIDHFKLYNDTNGHLPGDELLTRMGALLRENSRENEVVGRYGGEEFLIVMPGTPKDVGMRVAERIRAMIEGTDFEHTAGQPGGRVTISGGVATWPIDGEDVDGLLRHADAALYEAKRGGRNRVMAHRMTDLGQAGEAGHWAAGYQEADELELEKPER